jgi:hypothetical protein
MLPTLRVVPPYEESLVLSRVELNGIALLPAMRPQRPAVSVPLSHFPSKRPPRYELFQKICGGSYVRTYADPG